MNYKDVSSEVIYNQMTPEKGQKKTFGQDKNKYSKNLPNIFAGAPNHKNIDFNTVFNYLRV